MQAVADGHLHQLVVGGVVLDFVDPMAVAIVGAQHRLVAVGELTPANGLRTARERTEFGHLVESPLAALTDQRLGEDRRCGGVVVFQQWDLVGDDMRVRHVLDITVSRQLHKVCNTPGLPPATAPHTLLCNSRRVAVQPGALATAGPVRLVAGAQAVWTVIETHRKVYLTST